MQIRHTECKASLYRQPAETIPCLIQLEVPLVGERIEISISIR